MPSLHSSTTPSGSDSALEEVLAIVTRSGYQFITPTPMTHQRVFARSTCRVGTTLRDVFGWNLPFAAPAIAGDLLAAMARAQILLPDGELWRSGVRIASIDADLFLHSAFPTVQTDAVFFGPDTYRFGCFVRHALRQSRLSAPGDATIPEPVRVLDVGCGSGAGGVVAARKLAQQGLAVELVCNDINPLALSYAAINTRNAGIPAQMALGDALDAVQGQFDVIISNPPYLDDLAQRAYRHGGGRLGSGLSMRIAAGALSRLAPGGRLLLYTGVAIVDGHDAFLADLRPLLAASGCDWTYDEIDPDVFGEELDQPGYAHVERIAAVGLIATRHAAGS